MNNLSNEIVKAVPGVMKNCQLNITLSGTPAAVAIGLVCASGVVIYSIYRWANIEEQKLGVQTTAKENPTILNEEGPQSKAGTGKKEIVSITDSVEAAS